ncbi:MAG: hypothetical protein ACYDGY_03320 [Acidimicrobiales bacterium]
MAIKADIGTSTTGAEVNDMRDGRQRHGPLGFYQSERERWRASERSVRQVHWFRFSLAFFALVNVASHLYAIPAKYPVQTLWLEGEVAFYVMVAVIYILGLRMWYAPAILYTVFNLLAFFLSGVITIPGITSTVFITHLTVFQYSWGRGLSVLAWAYLLAVGVYMLRADKGSGLNKLLRDS